LYNNLRFFGFINNLLPDSIKLSPLVLRIRITNKCNLHCGFCYLSGNLNIGEENHLTLAEWKIIIDKLPAWTIIDITGAEPFLAKNFKEILELLLQRKFKVSITTNGYFLNNIGNHMRFIQLSLTLVLSFCLSTALSQKPVKANWSNELKFHSALNNVGQRVQFYDFVGFTISSEFNYILSVIRGVQKAP